MAKPSDYSPGGQVYDRTTGTWAGENQGNVGDDRSAPGRGTFVIHDANGPVGVHLAPARQVAAGTVETAPGGAGAGAGSAGVGGAGGSGPGSGAVVSKPGTVWWEKAGSLSVPAGSLVLTSGLPPLQPVMKGTNTAVQIGGVPLMPDPGTSDASEIEDWLGDGDNPFEAAWWVKQWAFTEHASHNMRLWANDPATQQWAKDFDQSVVNALTGGP